MKRALLIVGALTLVSALLQADLLETSEPGASDPTVGTIGVRENRAAGAEPGHPIPEPGTMAIVSMGLLAAAAHQKKRGQKQK